MKEKLKNKKVIAGIVAGISIVVVLVILVFINQSSLKLKNKEFIIEYGQQISLDPKEYLDEDEKIINKTTASIKEDAVMEEGKDYYPVGDYTLVFIYDKESTEVNIIVKDTTAPTFKDFKETIETAKDVKPDYTKLYQADDLSQIEIICEDTNVKYEIVGEYKATVRAIDTSKNEISKEITVKVTEPAIKLDKSSISLYVKETFILKPDIKGKEQKAIFKSGNDKIASVDENGKVTLKKKGTVTITAEANGVKAECKVTVKETPKGSTTEKKTVTNPTTGKKEEVTIVRPSGGSSSPSATPVISKAILNEINSERRKAGVGDLIWDDSLVAGAKIRAKEANQKFGHMRPDGSKWWSAFSSPTSGGSELLTKSSSPVGAWMNSAPHKSAMLDAHYTHAVVTKCGSTYVCILWEY